MEGAAVTYRCARCEVESAERSCFVFFKRYKDPQRNVLCVLCAQTRHHSSVVQNLITVFLTLVAPFLYTSMGAEPGVIKVPLGVEIALGCLAYPAALVAHELAHALTGYLTGLEIGGIGFGFGRVVGRLRILGVPIWFHAWPVSGRVYLGSATLRLLRTRVWLMTLMGPLTNILLVVAIATWWKSWVLVVGSPVISAWIGVNLIGALTNLMPRSGVGIGGAPYRSDGLALLKIPRTPASELQIYLSSALLVRMYSRFEREDFAGAQIWAEKALQRVPGNPHAVLALSACQISRGQYSAGRALLAPFLDRDDLAPVVRATIVNNVAFVLGMTNVGEAADTEQLALGDRLSSEAMALFPCVLEFRVTRALLLAATQRPDEALGLLAYMNFVTGTARQTSVRAAVRAFALRKLGQDEQAEKAAALAVRLSSNVCSELRLLGFVPRSEGPRPSMIERLRPALATWLRGVRASVVEDVRDTAQRLAEREPLPETYSALTRISGAILTLFGVGILAMTILFATRMVELYPRLDHRGPIIVLGLAALAVFCLTLGYRLLLNRPNRYGSLLSPGTWRALSIGFLGFVLLLVGLSFLSPTRLSVGALIGALMIAGWCWIAGRTAMRSRA
jgi:hypothetical protein